MSTSLRYNQLKGFTLVEIVVVVSIIGMLTAAAVVSVGTLREEARDKTRAASLQQLQLAITAYHAQNDNTYPTPGCSAGPTDWVGPGTMTGEVSCDNYIEGIVPDFMSALPTDPKGESKDLEGFMYRSDGTDYKVLVKDSVEAKFVESYSNPLARCPTPVGAGDPNCNTVGPNNPQKKQYAIYSKGAVSW